MEGAEEEGVYSVWALPSEDVSQRLKEVMKGLNKYFRGPEFEPHITVVGAIRLTKADAIQKFKSACEGLKSCTAQVGSIARGTFFYQCVFLLLKTTPEVMSTSEHCAAHFGYKSSSPASPPSEEGTAALNHYNASDSQTTGNQRRITYFFKTNSPVLDGTSTLHQSSTRRKTN